MHSSSFLMNTTLIVASLLLASVPAPADAEPGEPKQSLKYHDGEPDGKKSLGGTGMMIKFTLPAKNTKIAGLRIHGSRYGLPQPPQEEFLIYFLSEDREEIVRTEMAPYSLFERGDQQWVQVKFEKPIAVPQTVCVVLNFRAHRTKGVFVSYDTSTDGQHSRVGLPGMKTGPVKTGGDWMVEILPK